MGGPRRATAHRHLRKNLTARTTANQNSNKQKKKKKRNTIISIIHAFALDGFALCRATQIHARPIRRPDWASRPLATTRTHLHTTRRHHPPQQLSLTYASVHSKPPKTVPNHQPSKSNQWAIAESILRSKAAELVLVLEQKNARCASGRLPRVWTNHSPPSIFRCERVLRTVLPLDPIWGQVPSA